ncbi:MAG: thioredoxin-disulfide reductase [Lachnospiraceae bacterium]|nr:thioredoxin-disulfide reductase [Lachnospiraceae bacterium]
MKQKNGGKEEMVYDLIIIGSGPAGLSAAVYGRRAGLDLLVIEEKPMSGGQVLNTYEVDNYLGMPGINGFDMGVKFKEHADAMGAQYKSASVTAIADRREVKVVTTADGTEYEAKALILATGATHKTLGAEGETQYVGKGVSYCATCDGAFFKGRDVAVVGGGDVAVEDAIYLARMCRKVYLIHRRDSLRAAGSLQDKLFSSDRVEVLWNRTVSAICGSDLVESVKLRHVTEQTEEVLPVEGVFIAVGMQPNTVAFRDQVPCDDGGYVIAGEDCATQVPGILAAGDIRTKQVRQIVTAVADGACAVAAAERYLNGMRR